MKRQRAERSGREGETRAALWLRAKGWQILDRRVRTPAGEIDLVAKRGSLIAFTEVKWRRRAADLDHAIEVGEKSEQPDGHQSQARRAEH